MNTSSGKSKSKKSNLIEQLRRDYPEFDFAIGASDHWSPGSATISFDPSQTKRQLTYGVLHELAHALLKHHNYQSDFELVKLEARAWQLAAEIGLKYKIKISDDYIQNCLDTYRDWLHGRSTCPVCGALGLQHLPHSYQCSNCPNSWQVTTGHFARPYRSTKKHPA